MRNIPLRVFSLFRNSCLKCVVSLHRVVIFLGWLFKKKRVREKAILDFISENELSDQYDTKTLLDKNNSYYRNFQSLNICLLLTAVFKDTLLAQSILDCLNPVGLDIIDRYAGKGVIGVSFHIGPFTIIPMMLMLMGYRVTVLVSSDAVGNESGMNLGRINKMMDNYSKNHDCGEITFIDALSILSLVQIKKAINRGEILIIYPDVVRELSANPIPVKFFNTEISGHLGLAKVFRLTGADVLPMSIRWQDDKSMNLDIREPYEINPDDSDAEITEKIYGSFEKQVRIHPEQWIRVINYHKLKIQPPSTEGKV